MAEKRAQRAAEVAAGRSVAEQDRRARAELLAAQEKVDALWRDFRYPTRDAEARRWVEARVAGEVREMEERREVGERRERREEEFARRVGEEVVRGAVEALRAGREEGEREGKGESEGVEGERGDGE